MHWVTKLWIKTGVLFRDSSTFGVPLTAPFHDNAVLKFVLGVIYFGPIDLHSGDYPQIKLIPKWQIFRHVQQWRLGRKQSLFHCYPLPVLPMNTVPDIQWEKGNLSAISLTTREKGSLFDSRTVFLLREPSLFPTPMEVICLLL